MRESEGGGGREGGREERGERKGEGEREEEGEGMQGGGGKKKYNVQIMQVKTGHKFDNDAVTSCCRVCSQGSISPCNGKYDGSCSIKETCNSVTMVTGNC